jgi:tetratricopeptide (TPR) repeat protein
MDPDTTSKNLEDPEVNSSFFGLVYSSIHDSRKAMKNLLSEEYSRLDGESRKIYGIASLVQSHRMKALISLILRSEHIDPDWLAMQLRRGSLGGVLQPGDYGRTVVAPNRVVAEAISSVAFRTTEERKLAMSNLISAVSCEDFAEMEFLQNLLNGSVEAGVGPRYSLEQKIDLFRKGVERVRSRPLLIHLGRLETNAQRFSDAKKTLRAAFDAHVEGFDERPEHVRDAEGRLSFAVAESELSQGHCDIAWKNLEDAEEKFTRAKINPRITPHRYEGLGRTYLAKGRISKEGGLRWDFVLAAMQECNYVERYLGESSEIFLLKKEIERELGNLGFDESCIERVASRIGKANGYAYLAEIETASGNLHKALELVEKGLALNGMSIWLMRLRVYLLRNRFPDKHAEITKTLDDYSAVKDEQYDIELSFELAKETYMSGRVPEARTLFREVYAKARNHPRRVTIRDKMDRWFEGGKPKRLTGTVVRVPTEDRYGLVQTTFPTVLRDNLEVRRKDVERLDMKLGERISYEVVFNMFGPEASRVRRI